MIGQFDSSSLPELSNLSPLRLAFVDHVRERSM